MINLKAVNEAAYQRHTVGCLVLSNDHKLVLQLRDDKAPTFPGHLATFGGGIEKGETPLQAIMRELNEELGAEVAANDLTMLGVVTEPETNHHDLIYLYFWHDAANTISGCYEGEAKYFANFNAAKKYPNVMNDVIWAIEQSKKRGLL